MLFLISDIRKSETFNFFFACDAEVSVDISGGSQCAVVVDYYVYKSQFLFCNAIHNGTIDAENLSVSSNCDYEQNYKKYKLLKH